MILKVRQSQGDKVSEDVAALVLCHNVTPVYEVVEEGVEGGASRSGSRQGGTGNLVNIILIEQRELMEQKEQRELIEQRELMD